MANKVYEYVTEEIIRKMKEEQIAPWHKPWIMGNQVNYVTQKPYTGVNTLLLSRSGEYLTFKQIKEKKGHLKKGSKSEMVIFFKKVDPKNEAAEVNPDDKGYYVLRYYKVFHLSDVEGIESKLEDKPNLDNEPIEAAEKIVTSYQDGPTIKHIHDNQAYYSSLMDIINTPDITRFNNVEEYYSTLFHEMIHSTGHKDRLNRWTGNYNHKFGSKDYSKEELVAEIGASMLCGVTGIIDTTIDNSVAYLNSWIQKLQNDSTLIVSAAAQAQKACKLIRNEVE